MNKYFILYKISPVPSLLQKHLEKIYVAMHMAHTEAGFLSFQDLSRIKSSPRTPQLPRSGKS